MGRKLNIDGNIYNFPNPGENPEWGENVADWAEAVTEKLNTLSGSDDINRTSFTLANNISTPTNVTGLAFSTGTVRAGFIEYSIYRLAQDTVSGKTEKGEAGTLTVEYLGDSGTWLLSQDYIGDSGINFSITASGQIQYTSTNMPANTSYSATMIFQAKGFQQ